MKQRICVETKYVTLKFNVMGMFVAFALIVGLMFYVLGNRGAVKSNHMVGCPIEDAVLVELNGVSVVSWEVISTYRYMQSAMFGVRNAKEHGGKEVTMAFDNGRGFTQTEQYIISGLSEEEVYGMGMAELTGRGSRCHVTVSCPPEVAADILYLNLAYQSFNVMMLSLLLIGCVLMFFNLGIRLESSACWCRSLKNIYRIAGFAVMPLIMTWIMEYLGGSIAALKIHVLIANIVICTCLYLAAFIVTNRLRLSLVFINCMLFIIAVANHFVLLFRNSPLLPFDVLSLNTAMKVAGQYKIEISEALIFSIFLFIAVFTTAYIMPFKIEKRTFRVGFVAGGTGILIGMSSLFYGFLYQYWDLCYSTWSPIETYQQDGYLMSTMIFAKYAKIQRPKGYSAKKARDILASFEKITMEGTSDCPVNLIVIMNESWSTLDYIKPVKTNIPYDSFYQELSKNTIKGSLYVSICGGNTPQTEYEFFTGNSVSGLPNGATAYEFFVKNNTESICDILKQENYGCMAIHPFGAGSYHRDKVYDKFEFDKFITQKAFKGYEEIRGYYADRATFEKVIELYEAKKPGENLFLWDLTMQNHGGYGEWGGFEQDVYLTEYPGLKEASMYLTLMRHTDDALKMLISYFEKVEEPTMIVMFGDHQPALSDGTYDILYGKDENEVGDEEREKRYMTPFLIWNNYGLPEENIEKMSANYLSSYVFWKAGFSLTPYQKQLLDLYQYYPVINVLGVYDADGTFWSWEDIMNSPDYEKLHDYQIVQYYMIKK